MANVFIHKHGGGVHFFPAESAIPAVGSILAFEDIPYQVKRHEWSFTADAMRVDIFLCGPPF